jgi:hypothetical protein
MLKKIANYTTVIVVLSLFSFNSKADKVFMYDIYSYSDSVGVMIYTQEYSSDSVELIIKCYNHSSRIIYIDSLFGMRVREEFQYIDDDTIQSVYHFTNSHVDIFGSIMLFNKHFYPLNILESKVYNIVISTKDIKWLVFDIGYIVPSENIKYELREGGKIYTNISNLQGLHFTVPFIINFN